MSDRAPSTRWLRVLLVVGAGVVTALHIGKVPPAVPMLREALGVDMVFVGWVLSLFALAGAATGIGVGTFADRVGHRRTILLGLGLLTLGSVIGAFAHGGAALLVSRAVEATGNLIVTVAAPTLILRACNPRDMRLAFGLWGAWMPIGTSIMMASAPFLLPLMGWNAGWVVAAVASAVLALLLGWETRGSQPPAARPHGSRLLGDFREVLAQPGAWLCAAMFGFYSSTFMAVFGFLPTFLVERQGLGLTAAILLSALGVLMNAPGNIFGGWLARRGVPRWALIMIGCSTMALSSLGIFSDLLPVWARYTLALSFSFVGGFVPSTIFGIAPSFAPRPDLVSTVAGFVVQGSSIGQLLGPPVMAALVKYVGGWQAAPLLLTGAGCANVILALSLRRLERRRAALAVA